MDLFDWLDVISKLKDDGKPLKEIAIHLSWSDSKVMQYSALLNNLTNLFEICKQHQEGRVSENLTTVTFNFTERRNPTFGHSTIIYI